MDVGFDCHCDGGVGIFGLGRLKISKQTKQIMGKKPKKPSEFPPMLFPYIKTVTEAVLRRIAGGDYGMDAERHFELLKQVVGKQNGYLDDDQAYFPGEVIDLAVYDSATQGGYAYTVCSLILIQNQIHRKYGVELEFVWERYRNTERAKLPPSMRKELDAAYVSAIEKGVLEQAV